MGNSSDFSYKCQPTKVHRQTKRDLHLRVSPLGAGGAKASYDQGCVDRGSHCEPWSQSDPMGVQSAIANIDSSFNS